jgi:hypothetical protein
MIDHINEIVPEEEDASQCPHKMDEQLESSKSYTV